MIYDKLTADIKAAMLSKDTVKRDCLRSLVSEIKNQTVNAGKEITDDIVLKCVQKSVKQHQDSISQFEEAGRTDLAEKEKTELSHIEKYLPKMASAEETERIIRLILETVEPIKKNMGLVMKQLASDIDKKRASKILQGLLK
jgi:uncharacterized protein